MLIKLIPESSTPAVLFVLSFANAPFAYSPDKPLASVLDDIAFETSLFMSPGWANQLNTLAIDDLDPPTALHALDRAAGIPTLLQEVTLDVPSNTIRCSFVDGSVEEWMWPANPQTPVPVEKRPRLPYDAVTVRRYLEKLQSIVGDVTQSAAEEDRERQRELHQFQQEQDEHRRRSTEASAPTQRPPSKTHKKQRSFFMNIVASIVNLTPVSSTLSHSRLPPLNLKFTQPPKRSPSTVPLPPSPTPPPTPTRLVSAFPPLWSPPNSPMRQTLRQTGTPSNTSRTLRWRARSFLVDAFRRFVLPEIISRSPYGSYRNYHAINVDFCGPDGTGKVGAGYYIWTIESVLRRAGERMDELAQMAAAAGVEAGKERDRRTRTKLFPRFSVARRKANGSNLQVTTNTLTRRSAEEDRAQRERDRREAEYFASTTQSVQSPHLFSDEEEDATDDGRPKSSLRRRDPTTNEDEDTDSIETDTDGSSVHTPSSGHETFIFPPPLSKSGNPNMPAVPPKSTGIARVVRPTPVQAKPPPATLIPECPPPGSLPPTEMAEYKSLSRLTGKLQYLLIGAHARAAQAESEAKQREVVVEVRSRRRAWLNRSFGPLSPSTGAKGKWDNGTFCGYIATCTMSTPYMSSPLAKCVWTAEDWEYAPDVCVEHEVLFQERTRPCASNNAEQVGFGYQLRRMGSERGAKRGEPKLFPVTEEEEEEFIPVQGDEETLMGKRMRDDGLRELELGVAGLGLDLEAGEMAWIEDGGAFKTGIELDRPKVRKRTSSMYEHKSPFGRPQNPQFSQTEQKTLCDSSHPPGLTTSSLLCQPLTTSDPRDNQKLKPQIVFVPPPVDKALICESFVSEIKDSGEFTLSMDIPPPKRARSPPSVYGNLPATAPLPSPQSAKEFQFTIVPER